MPLNFRKNRLNRRRRAPMRRPKTAKVSKPLRRAIKQVVKGQVETKTINCPDADAGLIPTNTINKTYASASGVQYLVQDVFKCPQGVNDSTTLRSANRLGDSIQALGFKMNYYFHMRNMFNISSTSLQLPFVKLRVIVFTTAYGQAPLNYPLLFDDHFLNVETYTLQPVNRDEGYVKKVLYDKVFIMRNANDYSTTLGSDPNTQVIYGNVLHFQKYIKFNHKIRYMDNNGNDPTGTSQPIYIAITAEADDSLAGFPPSDTPLIYTTGYTQAWFKDA